MARIALSSTIFFSVFSSFLYFALGRSAPPIVEIPYNDYTVYIKGKSVVGGKSAQYLGLQYATAKRFMYSHFLSFVQEPTKFTEKKIYIEATEEGASCAQVCPKGNFDCIGSETQSEDCLTLDVSVPTFKKTYGYNKNSKYPVIVYFHGGAMRFGNTHAVYTGDVWSSRSEAITVTVSYRLGMFGWLKFGDAYPGNQGFTDQINALIWVKNYIQVLILQRDLMYVQNECSTLLSFQ